MTTYINQLQAAATCAASFGKGDEVVRLSQLALQVRKQCTSRAGADDLARTLDEAAKLHRKAGHVSEAVQAYHQAIEVRRSALEKAPWHWYLESGLGQSYEQLAQTCREAGDFRNEVLADREYLKIVIGPRHGVKIEDYTDPSRPADEAEANRIRELIERVTANGMKRFIFPCDFGGVQYPFHVYVTNVPWPKHPLEGQARWLREERGGTIPQGVMDTFRRLQKIAHENDVSFVDLCVEALAAPAADEGKELGSEKIGERITVSAASGSSAKADRDPLAELEARLVDAKTRLDNAPGDLGTTLEAADLYQEFGQSLLKADKPRQSAEVLRESVRLRELLVRAGPTVSEHRVRPPAPEVPGAPPAPQAPPAPEVPEALPAPAPVVPAPPAPTGNLSRQLTPPPVVPPPPAPPAPMVPGLPRERVQPSVTEHRQLLAATFLSLGQAHIQLKEFDAAYNCFHRRRDLLEQLQINAPSAELRSALAECYVSFGELAELRGDRADALRWYSVAGQQKAFQAARRIARLLQLDRSLAGVLPKDLQNLFTRMEDDGSTTGLAFIAAFAKEVEAIEEARERLAAVGTGLGLDQIGRIRWLTDFAESYRSLASKLLEQSKSKEALDAYLQEANLRDLIVRLDRSDQNQTDRYAEALFAAGKVSIGLGKTSDGIKLLEKAQQLDAEKATFFLASLYEQGMGVPEDVKKARSNALGLHLQERTSPL